MARRFTVKARTSEGLTVLVIEEADHAPVRWREVRYSTDGRVLDACGDDCERKQIAAFCQTYLQSMAAER